MHFSFFTFFSVSRQFPGHTLFMSHFPLLSVFSPQTKSYSVYFLYFTFLLFLAIFQVLQCLFLICTFYLVSPHIPGHKVFASHFLHFSVFLPQSRSDTVYFLYFRYFSVSRHIPSPTVCVLILHDFHCFSPYFMYYHVSFSFFPFVSFFAIFQVLQCEFFFFLVGQFCCHIPGHTVFVSLFPRLSVFSPQTRFYSVYFSYFIFFTVSRHISVPTVCVSHFFTFFIVSRHITGHTVFVSHFPCLSVFLPQSRSYSVYFSHFKFFTVSRHIPGPKVCVSPFSCFSVFLAIFQVLHACVSFYTFFSFLSIIQVLLYTFLIFHVFQCF